MVKTENAERASQNEIPHHLRVHYPHHRKSLLQPLNQAQTIIARQ